MKIVTTVKHWQIFAAVIGTGMIGELFVDEKSELFADIAYLAYMVIYIGWILVLGSILYSLNTPRYRTAYFAFIASGVILFSVVVYSHPS